MKRIKRIRKAGKPVQKDSSRMRIMILAVTLGLMIILWLERDSLPGLSKLGYIGVFFINFLANATVIFPLPGTASAFFAGAFWNPLLVGMFSGIGATAGELFGYFLGYGGRGLVDKYERKNKTLIKAEEFFRRNAFVSILILALIPFPFFDFVGILAGGISYPVWKFMIATATGRIIRDILFAFSGAKIL